MDKIKEIIKDNLVWIIIFLILVLGLSIYGVYNYIQGKEIYNDPMLEQDYIPLINYTYEDNEYRVITVEKYDVFNSYYQDFINKMLNDPKSSWDYVSEDDKKNNFNEDYEEYEKFVKTIVTVKSQNNKVEKYKVSNNTITVIDSENYMYEFIENGVWNYKVSFKGQVNK